MPFPKTSAVVENNVAVTIPQHAAASPGVVAHISTADSAPLPEKGAGDAAQQEDVMMFLDNARVSLFHLKAR